MRDRDGGVLYVGKASNLRRRVRAYFGPGGQHGRLIGRALEQLESLDHETCGSEFAALLREDRLIKELQPPCNRRGAGGGGAYLKLTLAEDCAAPLRGARPAPGRGRLLRAGALAAHRPRRRDGAAPPLRPRRGGHPGARRRRGAATAVRGAVVAGRPRPAAGGGGGRGSPRGGARLAPLPGRRAARRARRRSRGRAVRRTASRSCSSPARRRAASRPSSSRPGSSATRPRSRPSGGGSPPGVGLAIVRRESRRPPRPPAVDALDELGIVESRLRERDGAGATLELAGWLDHRTGTRRHRSRRGGRWPGCRARACEPPPPSR